MSLAGLWVVSKWVGDAAERMGIGEYVEPLTDSVEHKVLLDEAIGAVHDPEELDHLDDFLEVA